MLALCGGNSINAVLFCAGGPCADTVRPESAGVEMRGKGRVRILRGDVFRMLCGTAQKE